MITVIATIDASNPVNTDKIIDLSGSDTLPQNINLYAYGTDSTDALATLTYSWHILKKPGGSNAALSANNTQSVILNNVDVWGDYRVFCIATNSSTGISSEADPIKVQSEAFVKVRVKSTNLGLVKPAAGERDWFSYAYDWVDAIEALDPRVDAHDTRITALESGTNVLHTLDITADNAGDSVDLSTEELHLLGGTNIETAFTLVGSNNKVTTNLSADISLTSVNTSTLDVSTTSTFDGNCTFGGVLKDSVSPNSYLTPTVDGWKMSRDGTAPDECKIMTQCDVPTSAVRGGVKLSADQWTAQNTTGKIPSVHIITYSQQAEHTAYTNNANDTAIDSFDNTINAAQTDGNQITNTCHVLFQNTTGGDISLESISSVVLAGGDDQGTHYIFELVVFDDLAKLLSNTETSTSVSITHQQNSPWLPSAGELVSTNIYTVPNGAYFGMKCTQEAKILGVRYICNITAIRLI